MNEIPLIVEIVGLIALFLEARERPQVKSSVSHALQAVQPAHRQKFWRLVMWLTLVSTACYLWFSSGSESIEAFVAAAAFGGLAGYVRIFRRR